MVFIGIIYFAKGIDENRGFMSFSEGTRNHIPLIRISDSIGNPLEII